MYEQYAAYNGAAGTRESVEPQKSKETLTMLKRIGSTTFEVAVHFSETSNDTMADALCRLLEREVEKIA